MGFWGRYPQIPVWPQPQPGGDLPNNGFTTGNVSDCPMDPQGGPPALAFRPVVLIGLGHTGARVLEEWHHRAMPLPREDGPATMWLGQQGHGPDLDVESINCFYLNRNNLNNSGDLVEAFYDEGLLRRKLGKRVRESVQHVPQAMSLRVIMVANPHEGESHLVDALLYLLESVLQPVPNRQIHYMLLSVAAPRRQGLTPGEIRAGLRQIERRLHPGAPHLIKKFPTEGNGVGHSRVTLSHWWWVEGNRPEVLEASAEALLVLCQPGVEPLPATLLDDEPTVTGIGLSVRWMPIVALKEYSAHRLAKAVLIGEGHSKDNPLLTTERRNVVSLLNYFMQHDAHPFFAWLNNPSSNVPDIEPSDYHAMFVERLARVLLESLRERPLGEVKDFLLGLQMRLDEAQRLPGKGSRLGEALRLMQETVKDIVSQMTRWSMKLDPDGIRRRLEKNQEEAIGLMTPVAGAISQPLLTGPDAAADFYETHVRPELKPGRPSVLSPRVGNPRSCVGWKVTYLPDRRVGVSLATSDQVFTLEQVDEFLESVVALTRAQLRDFINILTGPMFQEHLREHRAGMEHDSDRLYAQYDANVPLPDIRREFIGPQLNHIFGNATIRCVEGGSPGRAILLAQQTIPTGRLTIRAARINTSPKNYTSVLDRNARMLELELNQVQELPGRIVKCCWDTDRMKGFLRGLCYQVVCFVPDDVEPNKGTWRIMLQDADYPYFDLAPGRESPDGLVAALEQFTIYFPFILADDQTEPNPFNMVLFPRFWEDYLQAIETRKTSENLERFSQDLENWRNRAAGDQNLSALLSMLQLMLERERWDLSRSQPD